MKKLLELGNNYVAASDWKDFAFTYVPLMTKVFHIATQSDEK